VFVDARTLPDDTLVQTDVCILGGGAAGITLARELAGQRFRVALLEAGGLDEESATPSLHEGQNVGIPYFPLERARLRYFGGSTNHWGGWSRPLDEIDFEKRSWIPYSGWPFLRSELDPYYERANRACGLGPALYDFADWREALARAGRRAPPIGPERLVDSVFQVIPDEGLRFGRVHREELLAASNLDVYLHANGVEIETGPEARDVRTLRVACLEGPKLRFAAKIFVLASGGLEIPRLLLASNRTRPAGLGNDRDLVGRFFLEHPYIRTGLALFTRPYRPCTVHPVPIGSSLVVETLGASPEMQRREHLANFGIRLLPVVGEWTGAVKRLLGRGAGTTTPVAGISSLRQIARDWRQVAALVSSRLMRRSARDILYGLPYRTYSVHYTWEQIPDPDSRVRLSAERDALGLPRIELDWRLNDQDLETFLQAQRILGEEVAREGLGETRNGTSREDWERVLRDSAGKIDDLLLRKNNQHLATLVVGEEATSPVLIGSYHHLGTTRMSDDSSQGVVDRHSRVHGVENLYVAGGSVFPTVGVSNPTLTIVALAIRLADRIKSVLPAGRPTTT